MVYFVYYMFSFYDIKKIFFKSILLGVVYFFSFSVVNAAIIKTSPATGSYTVGKTFPVTFYVRTPDKAINAVSDSFTFSADTLEITGFSRANSIFTLWVQDPRYDNSSGTGSFEGMVFNPGYIGSSGNLVTFNFRVKKEGFAFVNPQAGSILANDGLGTNIYTGAEKSSFSLVATDNKILPPTDVTVPVSSDKKNTDLPEVTTPAIFEVKELPRTIDYDPVIKFSIILKNKKIENKKYELRIDQGDSFIWEDTENTGVYSLTRTLSPGKHILFVKTVDNDLNLSTYVDFTIKDIPVPDIVLYSRFSHIGQQPFFIYGSAQKNNQIILNIYNKKEIVYTETVYVGTDEKFIFVINDKIPPGKYTMDLFARDKNGAISEKTDSKQAVFRRFAFIDLGVIALSLPAIGLTSLIILILCMVITTFIVVRAYRD